jgi:hypothetical protein
MKPSVADSSAVATAEPVSEAETLGLVNRPAEKLGRAP